jgi:hypothetical protein
VESNLRDRVEYAQPSTFSERLAVADECMQRLRMSAPIYLDGMDNAVEQAFGAWPERLFVIGVDGRIAYQGEKGPYGFNPEELDAFLAGYLG